MSEEVFKKFLVFLASNLNENKELLKLVQKRYDDCDDKFRISADFQALVDDVQSKMEIEKHRIFVHLKDFLSKLKSHRVGSSGKKRRRDGFCNNLAKRLCTGNSCSDVSSDSDFFKKAKENSSVKKDLLKDDLSSAKSDSPKDIDAINSPSPSSSIDKKTDANSKVGMGKSSDKPWPISDEESLSLDSVRSDTKSSDGSDLPVYSISMFPQAPASVSVDSVSSESKCSRSTPPPSTRKLRSLNKISTRSSNTLSETARESTQRKVSAEDEEEEVISEAQVVIDDDVSCSERPLPSPEMPLLNVDETKNEEEVKEEEEEEEEASSAADKEAEKEKLKKKKGSDRQVKRLEKLLGEIRDEIEKATQKELSIEDMEKDDSSYVYEDRLQKKFIKVWEKLCELKGQDTSTGRPIEKKFRFDGTRYTEVNKRIEKFINKKKIFPDYNDVKKIITQVNAHYNLYLGKSAIEDLAREAFTDVGNQLQDRRHKNFILTFGSSQTDVSSITRDPALFNQDLRKKLEENRKLAKNRLDEVISKYSKKQYETNAQPEEVDENVPDSSSEEEEEEPQDIPELDEVMALSDGDEDEDEVSEIPRKSSEMSFTKNLKIEIEKLTVPPGLLKKKPVPSSTAPCPSATATATAASPLENVNQNNSITTVAIPKVRLKQPPPHAAAKLNPSKPQRSPRRLSDSKAASNEIVIDLDSSSDTDDSAEVIGGTDPPKMTHALVPFGTRFPPSTVNSGHGANRTLPPSASSSSSSSTMVMSSQNSMQFSMQVKTQYQTQYQQQQKDGFSLKIASVSSLAYSIKDAKSNTQYFTTQQTNYQNQDIHLTPGTAYKTKIFNRARGPVPSNTSSVIVLSDSD